MDNLVYEESINTEINNTEFVSKKWIYANDNNSQNYSSQVILDTTALSNSGAYIMWSEAFIIMPLVVCLTAKNTTAGGTNITFTNANALPLLNGTWCFKSGFMNMIHSCTIEYNNGNVVQQTPFMNVFKNFEILTSWSLDNLKNDSASTGYYPDTSDTFGVSNSINQLKYCGVNGAVNQIFNNCVFAPSGSSVIIPQTAVVGTGVAYNADTTGALPNITIDVANTENVGNLPAINANITDGLNFNNSFINQGIVNRIANENIFSGTYKSSADALNQGLLYPNTVSETNWMNELTINNEATPTTSSYAYWKIYAKIYLKDFADIFQKTPLLKGSTMRFYINTNQCLTSFNVNTGTTATPLTDNSSYIVGGEVSVINNGGSTNPLMITNVMPQFIRYACNADNQTVDCALSVSIFKNNWSQQSAITGTSLQTNLQSCRLYAPAYKFTPLAEQKYLSLAPTKTIEYNDIFQYQFSGIQGNSDFNILVSNGLPNIQSVLVIPFLQTGATSPFYNAPYTSLLSPFSTSGSTPDPVALTNFNILLSGVNLFLDNEQYDFQQFQQELKSSLQLNGNLTNGLTSGLINEKDFGSLYRYYYGNCKRILPAEAEVSRSVQIRGKISNANSNQQYILFVFVEFKRKITIDLQTGARIE